MYISPTANIPMRLFLTGPSGCGKSTLLRHTLQDRLSAAGGFVTNRQTDEAGRPLYFYLQRANGIGNPEIFLDLRSAPPRKNSQPFTETAVRLLREPAPFYLLDEIGGMELLLPEFQAALDAFLTSDVPCIGVLKGLPNSRTLQSTANLPEAYLQAAAQLHLKLESMPHTAIVEYSDPAAIAAVTQWVQTCVPSRIVGSAKAPLGDQGELSGKA